MKQHSRLIRLAILGALALALVLAPLAGAGPFRTVQSQTKEPPLPGQKQIPFVPPQGQQPLRPVPVVPGPTQPFGPAPIFVPGPVIMEVPCPPVDPPTPVVKLQVRVVACSPAGKEIEYCLHVENCSPADAHHVVVRNPLPANCRLVRANPEPATTPSLTLPPAGEGKTRGPEFVWTFGTLRSGECREISLVLAPTDANDVQNCARVQFEHGQCVVTRIAMAPPSVIEPPSVVEPPKVAEPPKVIAPAAAKFSVSISGPKKQYANLPVKYQITVVNTGEASAENLLVTAFLPEKSTFVSAGDDGKFHQNQVAWLLGSLPAGATKTVQVSYRTATPGDFCLKGTALADGEIRAEAEACTKFEGVSALGLETADTKDPVEVGGQTSYRIVIYNQGSASLTNVQIQVLVPRELELVRATGASSPPTPDKLPAPTPEGQWVSFAPLREVKAGEKQVYEVFAKGLQPGDGRWKTVLTADQLTGGPVIEEESITVFREDLL